MLRLVLVRWVLGDSTACRRRIAPCLAAIAGQLIAGIGPSATAETIFFGPTPYLSAADSPFDLSGLGTTMFLEDFEDGELNTPGVDSIGSRVQVRSGPGTDSVDSDDGLIDGSGVQGHSAIGGISTCTDTIPPACVFGTSLRFDPDELGGYPTAVGIVWTDGSPLQDVAVGFHDSDGNLFAFPGNPFTLGDGSFQGETDEDRFFGVIHADGISVIAILTGPDNALLEVDHLQYGFFVPEPATGSLTVVSFMLLLAFRTLRRMSRTKGVFENRSPTHAPCKRWNQPLYSMR